MKITFLLSGHTQWLVVLNRNKVIILENTSRCTYEGTTLIPVKENTTWVNAFNHCGIIIIIIIMSNLSLKSDI